MQQAAIEVPSAPDGRPLAGAGARLGARVIDALVLMASLLIPILIFVDVLASSDSLTGPVVGLIATVIGFQYVYEVEIPLRRNGQTPGKRALKIAIAPLEAGVELRRGQLAGRFGVLFLFGLLTNCYVGYLDPLWCLWDKPYRQCLHDKPPKTVVVKLVA